MEIAVNRCRGLFFAGADSLSYAIEAVTGLRKHGRDSTGMCRESIDRSGDRSGVVDRWERIEKTHERRSRRGLSKARLEMAAKRLTRHRLQGDDPELVRPAERLRYGDVLCHALMSPLERGDPGRPDHLDEDPVGVSLHLEDGTPPGPVAAQTDTEVVSGIGTELMEDGRDPC